MPHNNVVHFDPFLFAVHYKKKKKQEARFSLFVYAPGSPLEKLLLHVTPSSHPTVIFFIVMIGLSCAEVVCSIIVLRLYHTGGRRQIPNWLRRTMLHPFIMRLYTNAECTAMLRAEDKDKE